MPITRHVELEQNELRVVTHAVQLLMEQANDDPSVLLDLVDHDDGETTGSVEDLLSRAEAKLSAIL